MAVLNVQEKQKVQYCIPLWLRDEQMKQNILRIPGRVEPNNTLSNEPVAIVCFGPSLNETWEQLKDFKTIFTCSGSHKFLVDKGIIPTYHVEVDPREHKTKLIGTPQKGVQYLIASCCHPKVIDLLEGFDVKLWHVFANGENGKTFPEIFPRGEYAITGGSSVGLRALTIARFLGYTNLYIFGMDGSFPSGQKHAAEHPNQAKDEHLTPYDGKEYLSTPAFLECARQTFHELNMMPDVTATFYGDSLVTHMSQHYVKEPVLSNMIAYNTPEVISPEYTELNKKLHKENLAYGVGGGKHKDMVMKLAKSINSTSILDYGCGKGYLAASLPYPIWEYDPAIPGKDKTPGSADLVVCTDVLEHIEPDKLDNVLADLKRCTKKLGYFVIHTKASTKNLADGRNSHLIQRGEKFWREALSKYFLLLEGSIINKPPLLYVIVAPQKIQKTNKK